MASVTFQHVYKQYRSEKRASVTDFHLEIDDGEFVVLVGPSGCGKTTTLRMLSGLEDITKGEIYIGDRYINYVSPKDRDIAMVFQNYALYPNLSVYENMALGLKLRKTAKHEVELRVKRAAQILEISALLHKKPNQLSGGQKQRVALGRAIVREPEVFLMDEPLSNLDAKLRTQTRSELIRLHQELRTTTLYVTHDQTEAMTMGARIVVMKDGLIQQAAAPEFIYQHPANLFVASFIGTPAMNLIEGSIEEREGQYVFSNKRLSLAIPPKYGRFLSSARLRHVVMGIRPEHMLLEPALEHPQVEVYPAVIDIIELMGSDSLLYLRLGDLQLIAKAIEPGSRFHVTDKIGIGFRMDKAHFFDGETGSNLGIF